MTSGQSVMIKSYVYTKKNTLFSMHENNNRKSQNMTVIKKNSSKNNSESKNIKKKPSYRVKRATRLERDEYEKLLKIFQEHYPKDFPKKKIADTIPTLSILKIIKKEKKILLSDVSLSQFFQQYVAKQHNKSLSNTDFKYYFKKFINVYQKDFAKDYSKTPTHSIFKKIKENSELNISRLTLHRFVNQYLKKQKIFLQNQEKKDKEILTALQNIYPEAFPKKNKKLLKLGIFEDIKNEGKIHTTDDDLKAFLKNYTKSEDYLDCYFTTPVRHDLKGNIIAPTTKKERFFAKKTLKKIQNNKQI